MSLSRGPNQQGRMSFGIDLNKLDRTVIPNRREAAE
jgi:hypothetical protein